MFFHRPCISFTIPGNPIPQKQTQWTRSGRVYDPSRKDSQAIQKIAIASFNQEPVTSPIEIRMMFLLKKPQKHPKHHVVHVKRPDIDNLAYLVTNALKGIVYKDDSQIYKMSLYKAYDDNPRTEIQVFKCD